MQPQRAFSCVALASVAALILGACQAPSNNSSAPSPTATQTAVASATQAAAAAPSGVTRDTLCARTADCYIDLAKKAAIERGGDASPVEREEARLRAHSSKKCMAQTENATPEAMASCMKLACAELVPCVAKLAAPK